MTEPTDNGSEDTVSEWTFIDEDERGHRRAFGDNDDYIVRTECERGVSHYIARPLREWVRRGGRLCGWCYPADPASR